MKDKFEPKKYDEKEPYKIDKPGKVYAVIHFGNSDKILSSQKILRDKYIFGESVAEKIGNFQLARKLNDLAFQLTGDLLVETGFKEEDKKVAGELFERSLHYQLKNGGFDWTL